MHKALQWLVVVDLFLSLSISENLYQAKAYPSNSYRDLDICNHWNGRRHFLELGERGDLHARNVTASAFRSTYYSPTISNNMSNRSNADIWYQCNLELVTCAECVIRIIFTHINFSKTCERIKSASGKPSLCPCEHIQFSEPPYDAAISGQEFCGDGKVLRSKTRALLLKFFYRATNSHVFSLQYFSERNVKIISGSPKQSIVSNYSKIAPQIISTPYFPMAYPRDYGVENILTCESENCQVRLDFTDFQLGLATTLEIFDSNGQMLDSYSGEHFRPPIIISSGKSLLLQFRGNGVSGVGFRAEVTFVSSENLKDNQLIPFTDCGGMVSGPGGAITMMNMIENNTDTRLYDCIWIIKPGNNYMMMKTHISLRVQEFYGLASRSDLTIRQGTTSDALEIESVVWPNNGMNMESHIVPILTGYYIRLRGVFSMSSKLAIVYSVFNYLNCYIGSEFLCTNNHCISIRLHCDGFDHCGDGSDEPDSCEEDWAHLQNDRRWYSHKPNYYFPKIEQYPDLKTATGIFIISTLGIFAVLSGWMVILYRMGVRARHQRELQSHLQTISELLDRQEEMSPDEPPVYEAPPDYEDVIKIGMDQEMCPSRQHQRRHHHRHHDHSCNRTTTPAADVSNFVTQQQLSASGIDRNDRPSTSAAAIAALATMITDGGSRELMETNTISATLSPSDEGVINPYNYLNVMRSSTNQPTTTLSGENNSSTRQQQRPDPPSRCNSPSQFEECSNEFKDDSLDISFTLAIPPSSAYSEGEAKVPRSKSGKLCTEQTHLKRSWIVINDGYQSYKIQRLRHTFSSPDAFPVDFYLSDSLIYGTNVPRDRNSIFSNASNFGSELSRDPSSTFSFGQPKAPSKGHHQRCAVLTTTPSNSDAEREQIFLWNTMKTYTDEPKISCFGNVNKSIRIRTRHVRSKSFSSSRSNSSRRRSILKIHKRSSSLDLLTQNQHSERTALVNTSTLNRSSNGLGAEETGSGNNSTMYII